MEMIRIERGAEVSPGVFEYHCLAWPLVCGKSRQPLLDACRQFKTLYGLTKEAAGVFRNGSSAPDISCRIEVGASLTTSDPSLGRISFVKFTPFEANIPPRKVA